jgi:elongation factor 2
VKLIMEDANIHVDPAHIGPGQIIPAMRNAAYACILAADPTILEPIYKVIMTVSPDLVGAATRILSQKRGRVVSVDQREYLVNVIGEMPAAESFDLSEAIRSGTGGRAFWQTTFERWQFIPESLKLQVIQEIRKRRGLPPEIPKCDHFLS